MDLDSEDVSFAVQQVEDSIARVSLLRFFWFIFDCQVVLLCSPSCFDSQAAPAVNSDDDDDYIEEPDDLVYVPCPVCHYKTLHESGTFSICMICSWEDDGCPESRALEVLGGPNKDYSLGEARSNFATYLTMYRPEDAFIFLRSTEEDYLLRKERVCIGLEARDRAPDNENEWIEFDRQWPIICEARDRARASIEAEAANNLTQQLEFDELQRKAIDARAAIETVKEIKTAVPKKSTK
jgi:hypothetical protein